MKKLLLIIIASFYLLGVFSGSVFAATNIYESGYEDPCEQAGFDDPQLCGYKNTNEEAMAKEKVGKILNVVYGLIGIVAVIFVIIGGFKYMTSQGEKPTEGSCTWFLTGRRQSPPCRLFP